MPKPGTPTITIKHKALSGHYYEWEIGFHPDDEQAFKDHVEELWTKKHKLTAEEANDIYNRFDDYYNKF